MQTEYVRSRNSILIYGIYWRDFIVTEFNLSTNQCTRWKWTHQRWKERQQYHHICSGQSMHITSDNRYLIVVQFGKRAYLDQDIVVVDMMQKKLSPVHGLYSKRITGAVMMHNDPIKNEWMYVVDDNGRWNRIKVDDIIRYYHMQQDQH